MNLIRRIQTYPVFLRRSFAPSSPYWHLFSGKKRTRRWLDEKQRNSSKKVKGSAGWQAGRNLAEEIRYKRSCHDAAKGHKHFQS